MTRDEFLEEMYDIGDLINFCNDNGCDVTNDVVDEYTRDEYINDMLAEEARSSDWREMYRWLDDVNDESGYDYYEYDSYDGRYRPAEYRDLFDRVLEWADDSGFWDEPEEEAEFVPQLTDEELYELEPTEEEDCSVMDMFTESNNHVRCMTEEDLENLGNSMRNIQELISA